MEHLSGLEEDFAQTEKVRVVRSEERIGLIRGRLLGVDHAQAEVLTFLDSHCEVAQGWLEPLLARISYNINNVVCPVIDSINPDTFRYQFRFRNI